MKFKDYYQTLGVERGASDDEIKRAYRKLARKFHPAVSKEPQAEERFKELGEAYEVLKDPEKRAAYDRLGANYQAGQDFQPPPDWGSGFEFSGAAPQGRRGMNAEEAAAFSDFFESLFGGEERGRRSSQGYRARSEPPADHHARIAIDLDDAYHGAERSITLQSPQVDAAGHVVMQERSLNVKIPRGVREGQRLRLAGQGAPGSDGKHGDLYLEVQFKPHPWYRVVEKDLYLTLPVAPWEAALGGEVTAPTPAGKVQVSIPAGSQTGRKLRLKGRGLPAAEPGDLYIELKVVLPAADNPKAVEAYKRMAAELRFNPRLHFGV